MRPTRSPVSQTVSPMIRTVSGREPAGEADGAADGGGVALDGSGEGATDGGADAADGAALDVGTPLAPGAATQPMAMVADRTAAAGRSSRVMAAR